VPCSLLRVAEVRFSNGSSSVPVIITKQPFVNDSQVLIFSIQDPGSAYQSIIYDPDFGVTLSPSKGGDGDNTQTLLLAILLPVLVSLACVIVVAIVAAIIAVALVKHYRYPKVVNELQAVSFAMERKDNMVADREDDEWSSSD